MYRMLLLIFGSYGLIVTCLDGIKPFLEVSLLMAWVVENWLMWTRMWWEKLFAFIGISLSEEIADGLSGIVYCLGTIFGIRRIREYGFDGFTRWLNLWKGAKEYVANWPKLIRYLIGYVFSVILFLPWLIVYFMLAKSSLYIANTYAIFGIIAVYLPGFTSSRMQSRIEKWLGGKNPTEISADDSIAFTFLTVPVYVLAAILFILLLNEVAMQGDNIMNFIRWMRCDAGIECAK